MEHESRMWFNEERRDGNQYRLAIQPLCWSKGEKGGNPKLGGQVVCAGLDLLPSDRKKVEREQIWDQRRYAARLHTLHHTFIRVDAHGAGMSHTAILLLLI